MPGLSPEQLANWLSLYVATGICASIGALGAVISVGCEVIRRREWRHIRGGRAAAMVVPQLWWRWQKRYLTATPVILGIVGYYATSLSW